MAIGWCLSELGSSGDLDHFVNDWVVLKVWNIQCLLNSGIELSLFIKTLPVVELSKLLWDGDCYWNDLRFIVFGIADPRRGLELTVKVEWESPSLAWYPGNGGGREPTES